MGRERHHQPAGRSQWGAIRKRSVGLFLVAGCRGLQCPLRMFHPPVHSQLHSRHSRYDHILEEEPVERPGSRSLCVFMPLEVEISSGLFFFNVELFSELQRFFEAFFSLFLVETIEACAYVICPLMFEVFPDVLTFLSQYMHIAVSLSIFWKCFQMRLF